MVDHNAPRVYTVQFRSVIMLLDCTCCVQSMYSILYVVYTVRRTGSVQSVYSVILNICIENCTCSVQCFKQVYTVRRVYVHTL